MIDVAVIGGGQAGLTMSHALSRRGIAHVVLERHRIAERWRSERWDSLRFQFPNWALRLPDFAYVGDKPDEYAHRDDVVRFIESYAESIQAPVRTGVTVQKLRRADEGFALTCENEVITARNVVIATGPYQQTIVPDAANGLGDVIQLTASDYRNPEQLPDGGVLVVGAGASGCQIAEELRGQFYLTYTPDMVDKEGGYHKIALKSANDGMTVAVREGYYAGEAR